MDSRSGIDRWDGAAALDAVNLVKNPNLARGKAAPRSWNWCAHGPAARWGYEPPSDGWANRVMRIACDHPEADAVWSQTLRAKAGRYYRLEAEVTCMCHPEAEAGGLILAVRCQGEEGPIGETLRFAPVRQTSRSGEFTAEHAEVSEKRKNAIGLPPTDPDRPLVLRGYFKTPVGTCRMEIRIGLVGAVGWARVYDVRLFPIMEPDACSHVLAIPPPSYAQRPLRTVRRAVVYGEAHATPSLLEALRRHCGTANVRAVPVRSANARELRADAILVPGDRPPPEIRGLDDLERLAGRRTIVISIEAFASLSQPRLETRLVEQRDDPMHARVVRGCALTAGFALHDVFPFAGMATDPTGFGQRQFVNNREFRDFRQHHGYEVFLTAVTDRDATMDQPIGLFKATPGGVVVVCDLAALEAPPTTLGEVNLAGTLLLNMLGSAPPALGQYAVPARNERDFRQELIELQGRFEPLTCLGLHRSETSARGVVVKFGDDDESFALSPHRRPALLVRTGVRGGDEDGIYGTMLWLKQLVRPLPFPCPYARYLTRRFRVFWRPLHRPWNEGIGLSPCLGALGDSGGEFDPGVLGAILDVTVGAEQQVRVMFARPGALFERCARALPALARACAPPGARRQAFGPEIVVEGASFSDPLHRRALAAGADVVRLELPHTRTDLMADSIRRTDRAACTLEDVVGQVCDAFVMNHTPHPLELDATDIFGESCEQYGVVRGDPATGEDRAEHYPVRPTPRMLLAPGTAACKWVVTA